MAIVWPNMAVLYSDDEVTFCWSAATIEFACQSWEGNSQKQSQYDRHFLAIMTGKKVMGKNIYLY